MPKHIADEELLEDIRRVATELGRPPTYDEMDEKGEYGTTTHASRFGSWSAALEQAGFEGRSIGGRIPTEDLIIELREVCQEIGDSPTMEEFDEISEYSPHTYQYRFGSWKEALEEIGCSLNRGYSRDGLIEFLNELYEDIGRTPTIKDIMASSGPSVYQFKKHFGSWNNALEEAGMEVNIRRTGSTEVDCETCGETLERSPFDIDRNDNHFCDNDCYSTWLSHNQVRENNPSWKGGYQQKYGSNWKRNKRKARERDGYQCQGCGINQDRYRAETGWKLDVHHIVPAREFETPEQASRLSNLVTLCRSCHIKWEGIPLSPAVVE